MKIALAQINNRICDFDNNSNKIIEQIKKAHSLGCELIVFPELALFGYWPGDLLERSDLVEAQLKSLKKIKSMVPEGLVALVGVVTRGSQKKGKRLYNSVALLQRGKKERFFSKELLPQYDIYDEERFFLNGNLKNNFFKIKNKKILVSICEDMWAWEKNHVGVQHEHNPFFKIKNTKPSLVINISASPYSYSKNKLRKQMATKTARFLRAPVLYVNQVTTNDEIIFDGGSFICDPQGKVLKQASFFKEELLVWETQEKILKKKNKDAPDIQILKEAIVFGIQDYLQKSNIQRVHLGLSGGVDSALVACLACDAVGPSRVTLIALPGPYSSQESFNLALKLSENLKCEFFNVDINGAYKTFVDEFETSFGVREFSLVHENLQSRLRGVVLMAYSNHKKSLLLTTGNKSEYATGYATLYGDMCGGLAPIGDLLKRQVYEICELYNKDQEIIPRGILTRPPTAELRENQKDEDTLPPYSELDQMVEDFICYNKKPNTQREREVYALIQGAEFKRKQAPPILRISDRSFGKGRRYPISWGPSAKIFRKS